MLTEIFLAGASKRSRMKEAARSHDCREFSMSHRMEALLDVIENGAAVKGPLFVMARRKINIETKNKKILFFRSLTINEK